MKFRLPAALVTGILALVAMTTSLPAAADLPAATGYINCTLGVELDPSSCGTSFNSGSRTLSPYAGLSGMVQLDRSPQPGRRRCRGVWEPDVLL